MSSTEVSHCACCPSRTWEPLASSVPHLLHTNTTPSDRESLYIHDTISLARSRIAKLDDDLKAITRRFRRKRNETEQFVKMHQRLLSLERRIPKEILSTIFVRCLPDRWPDDFTGLLSKPIPILLSQVCSLWRSVAISTPELWSSIQVDISRDDSESRIEWFRTWLSRNGSAPVRLRLRIGPNIDPLYSHPLIPILSSQSDRWQHLQLIAPWASINSLVVVRNRLSSLKSLFILSITGVNGIPDVETLSTFSVAPQLRNVEIGGTLAELIVLPWNQLESCRFGDVSSAVAFNILVQSLSLVECTMRLMYPFPPRPVHTLSKLRTLVVGIDQANAGILDCLTLPSLCTLTVQVHGLIGQQLSLESHLVPLVRRSLCNISHLSITGRHIDLRSTALIRCLEAMPSLIDLVLRYKGCVSNNLLNQLTYRGPDEPFLAPRLETIGFDLFHSAFDNKILVNMFESRCNAESSQNSSIGRLSKVKFCSIGFQLDAVTRTYLEHLEESGIRVSITGEKEFLDT